MKRAVTAGLNCATCLPLSLPPGAFRTASIGHLRRSGTAPFFSSPTVGSASLTGVRGFHSSRPVPASIGLFGDKKESDSQKNEELEGREYTEQDAAEDEATAAAVVERATGHKQRRGLQPWAPLVKLPIESFLESERTPLGSVSLNANIFLTPIRRDILQRVVVWQLAKRRQGTHKTKSKAEVRGGGRKPRPQKGSGRSRMGSIRSPLCIGGGHAFAKRNRDYSFPLLRKVRKMGLKIALSLKLAQGKVRIVRSTQVDGAKTKSLDAVLHRKKWRRALVIDGKAVDESFRRASNNLPSVKVLPVGGCNVFDILNHDHLILTLEAVQYLEGLLLDQSSPQFYAEPTSPATGRAQEPKETSASA